MASAKVHLPIRMRPLATKRPLCSAPIGLIVFCGDVRYRAIAEAEWVGNCHCTTCPEVSGAAFSIMAVYSHDALARTADSHTVFKFNTKLFQNAAWVADGLVCY